jgi:3-dehydroquinate synthase
VDVSAGKNLIGAFCLPRLVLSDPVLLATLPDEDFRDGLAEAVKHAVIADAAHFDWLEAHAEALARREPDAVDVLLRRSVEIKLDVVSADPLEEGRRAVLNFGHTIAHALERLTGYALSHGRAVAIGLVAEAELGVAAGVTDADVPARIMRLLGALGLPAALPDVADGAALLGAARSDKKARDGTLRFALIERIGRAAPDADGRWTRAVDESVVLEVVARMQRSAATADPGA